MRKGYPADSLRWWTIGQTFGARGLDLDRPGDKALDILFTKHGPAGATVSAQFGVATGVVVRSVCDTCGVPWPCAAATVVLDVCEEG